MAIIEYLVALGSNQRHFQHGSPQKVLNEAIEQLDGEVLSIQRVSRIVTSRPIGPSRRTYANAAITIESSLVPEDMLSHLKREESKFGDRKGQRWSSRVLDLDIILCNLGLFHSSNPDLCIPHYAMRERLFVLDPAADIAPQWRDPISNLTIRHLLYRLKRAKPLDRKQKRY